MFRCSATCCEDQRASMQQVHRCIERCHEPLAQAQALVTGELERFQVRDRCAAAGDRIPMPLKAASPPAARKGLAGLPRIDSVLPQRRIAPSGRPFVSSGHLG